MPTVSIERDVLFGHLGRRYGDDEFDELCFEYGIELDEITSELEEATKSSTSKLSPEQLGGLSSAVIYKIDVPANRYDLLCVEGISRALKIFLGDADPPVYKISDVEKKLKMRVSKSNVDAIRPFVVCAVLRGISFRDEGRYKSFIDLQDQLHRNLCRQRTLVAIGTHDLDTVRGPFLYDARSPTEIEFVPLTPSDRSYVAKDLLEVYETDVNVKHLKPYVPIIKDSPLYPVIYDDDGVVLSLPPLINGDHSKITPETTNVLIECTATDLTKANIVLDTVVAMFSEYCSPEPYSVEPVDVVYEDAEGNVERSYVTPLMSSRRERARVDFCNSLIGIDVQPERMRALCDKVQLGPATLSEGDAVLEVTVPPTRSDILHAVDIAEDIGIAYGYNNIVKRVAKTSTVGGELPLNQITDLLREEIARAGYIEILTHGLCSIHDNYVALRRKPDPVGSVSLLNPANVEYQIVRTTLLPGLLKTLQHNRSSSFASGFQLFEISDAVISDPEHAVTETVVGARNVRNICAVYSGPTSGFEIIHGLVDRIMTLLEIAPEPDYVASSLAKSNAEEKFRVARDGWYYTIEEIENDDGDEISNTYFPGRAARVMVTSPGGEKKGGKKKCAGTFGILHPEVLSNFAIDYPSSCVEMNLEDLV